MIDIKEGDVYESCGLHAVRCTYVNREKDTIQGHSLFDFSRPHSCSFKHCGVRKLSREETMQLIDAFHRGGMKLIQEMFEKRHQLEDDHHVRGYN